MSWAAANKKRYPFMTDAKRALQFIRARCAPLQNGCIQFLGKVTVKTGHSQASFGGRRWTSHRFIYHALVGPIPYGLHVCHSCDNPRCMNIDHLWLGTQLENNRDMYAKGRGKYQANRYTHCKNGHEFTQENTRITKQGFRQCRECNRLRLRKDYVPVQRTNLTLEQERQRRYKIRAKQRKLSCAPQH
jgi:hypothetical protein